MTSTTSGATLQTEYTKVPMGEYQRRKLRRKLTRKRPRAVHQGYNSGQIQPLQMCLAKYRMDQDHHTVEESRELSREDQIWRDPCLRLV